MVSLQIGAGFQVARLYTATLAKGRASAPARFTGFQRSDNAPDP